MVLISGGQTCTFVCRYVKCICIVVNVSVKVNTKQLVVVTDAETETHTHRCITDREKSCVCGWVFPVPRNMPGAVEGREKRMTASFSPRNTCDLINQV